jgi:hypothetical protein
LTVTIANCIAWLSYGLLKHDPFVTAPNAAGVLIAVFMTLTAFGLADELVGFTHSAGPVCHGSQSCSHR